MNFVQQALLKSIQQGYSEAMSPPDKEGRRRLRPDARRATILAAARELFLQRPYRDVTIAAVAQSARSSTGLVYRYHESKESLYAELMLESVIDLMARHVAAQRATPPGAGPGVLVRVALEVHFDHVASRSGAWMSPHWSQGEEPPMTRRLRDELRQRYASGLVWLIGGVNGRREEYAVWGWLGQVEAAGHRWLELGCPASDREPLMSSLLQGLAGALGGAWSRSERPAEWRHAAG